MASWQRIIMGPAPPHITCIDPTPSLIGAIGLVTCYESIGQEWLIATNLFVREGSSWAIFHHQSGPTVAPPEPEDGQPIHPMN